MKFVFPFEANAIASTHIPSELLGEFLAANPEYMPGAEMLFQSVKFKLYVLLKLSLFYRLKIRIYAKGHPSGVFYYGFLSGKEEKPNDI